MRDEVARRLATLNREFYDAFADAFAGSRGRTEPGLERALARVEPGSRVLDVGCGHGRVATLLPSGTHYVGLDFSPEMLALAEEKAAGRPSVHSDFVAADLLDPHWERRIDGTFDWIVFRAVLHHVPGYANRLRILRQAARLLAPGGHILLANWQFLRLERLRRRLQPWEEAGLLEADVEAGDYLLDWRRQGRGLRYVHLVDEVETLRLAQEADLKVEALFSADGRNDDLTLYAILTHPSGANPLSLPG
jgi:SAM-dependent methyltransferase